MTAIEWLGSRLLTCAGCVVVLFVFAGTCVYAVLLALKGRKCWRF